MTDAVRSVHEPSAASGDDLAALHAREIDRLVAYLFSSDRALGTAEAEAVAQQAFVELRASWPGTGGFPSHQVHVFATAQRIASTWPRRPQQEGSDPLRDSAPTYWDRADVTRLTVLQDSLDRLPDIPRRVVLLRELCGFGPAETAMIVAVPEAAAETARGDGLRALVPMIEAGTSSGNARRGPLVPEDFGALGRVLQIGDGRVAAARARFAASLAPGADPGLTQPAVVQPAPPRPPAGARPGSTPPPPTVAPSAPPSGSLSLGRAAADVTQILPAATTAAPSNPSVLSNPSAAANPPAAAGPSGPGMPLGPQAYTLPGPPPGAPLAPAPAPAQPPAPAVRAPMPVAPTPSTLAAAPAPAPRFSAPPVSGLPRRTPAAVPDPIGQGSQGWSDAFGAGSSSPSRSASSPPAAPSAPAPSYAPPSAAPPVHPPQPVYTPPPSPLDVSSPLTAPVGSLANIGTPIFDSVSAWFSTAGADSWATLDDAAWREAGERAAAAPTIEGSTSVGLPRRRPGANTVPSAEEATSGRSSTFGPPSGQLDAGTIRTRLGGLQDGLRNARRQRPDVNEPIAAEAAAALEASGNLFSSGAFPDSGSPRRPRFQAPEATPAPAASSAAPAAPAPSPAAGPRGGQATEGTLPQRAPGRRQAPAVGSVPSAPSSGASRQAGPAADRGAPAAAPSDARPSEARGFGAFYRDYLPQLLALLMVEGARPALAAEIAQDVMSAAYREWARIDAPRDWTRERALAAWSDRREGGGPDAI